MLEAGTVKIDCYISHGCQSENSLKENVTQAISLESCDAEVQYHRIDNREAERKGLKGSPSVLINGVDILPGEIPGAS